MTDKPPQLHVDIVEEHTISIKLVSELALTRLRLEEDAVHLARMRVRFKNNRTLRELRARLDAMEATATKPSPEPVAGPLLSSPPRFASLVFAFLAENDAVEEALGDLEESFHAMEIRFGARAARCWYHWRAIGVAVSFVIRGAERILNLGRSLSGPS